jgi:hypothetical protein
MYKPSTYLQVAYFATYLPISETYFLQNWLLRWNQILPQLRFIHNWVIVDMEWMVCWWVLVQCGQEFAIWSGNTCHVLTLAFFSPLWDQNWNLYTFFNLIVRLESQAHPESKQRRYEMSTYAQMPKPIINHEVARLDILVLHCRLCFLSGGKHPRVVYLHYCMLQHRCERWILLLSIGW